MIDDQMYEPMLLDLYRYMASLGHNKVTSFSWNDSYNLSTYTHYLDQITKISHVLNKHESRAYDSAHPKIRGTCTGFTKKI